MRVAHYLIRGETGRFYVRLRIPAVAAAALRANVCKCNAEPRAWAIRQFAARCCRPHCDLLRTAVAAALCVLAASAAIGLAGRIGAGCTLEAPHGESVLGLEFKAAQPAGRVPFRTVEISDLCLIADRQSIGRLGAILRPGHARAISRKSLFGCMAAGLAEAPMA